MRQIGLRQEAGLVGGIGPCGRELCCSTWLSDFKLVSTHSARYQNISINTDRITGQCGRLKCCLNYELDMYLEALKDFPVPDTKLQTEKGVAFCQKVDIFKETLWFSYRNDPSNWHALNKKQVHEIVKLNSGGKKIASLEEYAADNVKEDRLAFENVVGQDSLTRFDKPKRRRKGNKKHNRRNKKRKTSPNA